MCIYIYVYVHMYVYLYLHELQMPIGGHPSCSSQRDRRHDDLMTLSLCRHDARSVERGGTVPVPYINALVARRSTSQDLFLLISFFRRRIVGFPPPPPVPPSDPPPSPGPFRRFACVWRMGERKRRPPRPNCLNCNPVPV